MYPENIGLHWGYDEKLAHLIEAGLDIYVMPSRYEPCGLNQMYSLKYGTIPVVRATGGLDDTIEEWNSRTGKGNGFKFNELNKITLYNAIKNALDIFPDKKIWRSVQKNAMEFHYSWDQAVVEYEKVYDIALEQILNNKKIKKTP
jgi:starch synthase